LPFLEDALLTLPRQQSDPPQQLLLGLNNDMVRGELTFLDDATVTFRSRSREFRVPRTAVTGLVWYAAPAPPARSSMRVVLTDHSLVTLDEPRIIGEYLRGRHPELGEIQLPLENVSELLLGGVVSSELGEKIPQLVAKRAPEPQFQDTAPGRKHRVDSPLLGKQLSDLEFPLLNDQVKRLFEYEGSVLILEFWATWCAPCVKNMPRMIELANDVSESSVALLAVNFREEKHLVEEMRDARKWDVDVALDPTGMLARNFMVESLPCTVIIDQDGKVSAVFVGAGSEVLAEVRGVIEQLVQP
jgi:thiol-disulfide isomerase/thioredoxin